MQKIERSAIYGALAVGAAAGAVGLLIGRRTERYSYRGKAVLITGGSRGLGLILARRLTAMGAAVAICARDVEELRRAGNELRQLGGNVIEIVCDVRVSGDCERAVAACVNAFGGCDVLINDAGVIQAGPLESQTIDDFREAMDTHFWGAYNMMTAALPHLKRRKTSRIVNIASIGGKIAIPHLAPYSASKFALVGLSQAYRTELAKYGIKVTTVCPGLMRTGSHVNAYFKGQFKKEYAIFSIMDAFPLASVNADRAAEQVLESARRGDAELIISLPAKLAAQFNAILPQKTSAILSAVTSFLPGPGGDTQKHKGIDSTSPVAPSVLTAKIDDEAVRNNELAT